MIITVPVRLYLTTNILSVRIMIFFLTRINALRWLMGEIG